MATDSPADGDLGELLHDFPGLRGGNFQVTSPANPDYNCISWAAGRADARWWPGEAESYWPADAPNVDTLDAFRAAFTALGYEMCDTGELESGFEKIALFSTPGQDPTHAARQLPSGEWTSKMGRSVDITHLTLQSIEGEVYGRVAIFMRRVRTT